MKFIRTVVIVILLTLVMSACFGPTRAQTPGESRPPLTSDNSTQTPANPPTDESHQPLEETPDTSGPEEDRTTEAVWIAAGDVMMHTPQYPGSYDSKRKRYIFDPFFEQVRPILEEGDWTIVNLEVPLGGEDLKYTGYPLFNAPPEMAEALKKSGINIVGTANNHALDRGEKGVIRTIAALKEQGLIHNGTASSQAQADQAVIIEKNEIRMGFLAYTYGTNGIPIPEGKPYLVSLIDEQRMVEDIEKLKAEGADFITVNLHFGIEYQFQPNEEQQRIAHKLIEAGADIIAGSHPHVVQPYEVVDTVNADGSARRSVIIYSMGNFISNQQGDFKDYGVIFRIHVRKQHGTGEVEFTKIEPIPTWVYKYKQNGLNQYRILPVEETLSKRNQPGLAAGDYKQLESSLNLLTKRLNSMLK
ncbi:CapA family protein [Paenibacillus sp. GCM10012307]|uniref:CapA family protein n=1 Tax=Paenibacillus roseus TaxID=2798579 RepID=A0A934JAS1_9BACL|nr:CapA family protein [Paenibacillus roseus]MBJ6363607.1 CapA family protein [Paenibacillus roseus]